MGLKWIASRALAIVLLVVPGVAAAQDVSTPAAGQEAPRRPAPPFRPEVTFGIVFDDNILSRPQPEGDIFIRLSPGFEYRRDTRPLVVVASLHFDAERYQDRPDLDTPVARQNTAFDLTWRPGSRFALRSRFGYQRTQTPQDLNITSGLVGGRQEASRIDVSVGLEQTVRPRHRLWVGADFGHDDIKIGIDSTVRSAGVRYLSQVSTRNDLSVQYRLEQREFLPGPLVTSHIATAAWNRLISRAVLIRVEGGIRMADGEIEPEVLISGTRSINGVTSLMLQYAHTQDVAVGVAGLLTIDRVYGTFTVRRDLVWEFVGGGGAFRNVQSGSDTVAYDGLGSVGRALGEAVWLVASVNRTWNSTRFTGTVLPNTDILRNWVMVSLRIAPWRPR